MLSDTIKGKDLEQCAVLLFYMQRCSFDLTCLIFFHFIFMPIKHHKHLRVIGIADLGP